MPVPQTEQTPFIAGRPFFIVTLVALLISLFILHFTQYPVSAKILTSLFKKVYAIRTEIIMVTVYKYYIEKSIKKIFSKHNLKGFLR